MAQAKCAQNEAFSGRIDTDFQTFYRANFDYKLFQQMKLEQLQCIQVHCYPLAEPRYAKFNHQRADFCVKKCNQTMDAYKSHQVATLADINTKLGESSEKSLSSKEQVFREAVARLDRAAHDLLSAEHQNQQTN